MFDIREYYQDDSFRRKLNHIDISDIENDISYDLENLLKNRFDNLYQRDSYKSKNRSIEIIYPNLAYPGNRSLMLNPDKIRFLLSSYPANHDIMNIDKIVIRPRYIEIDKVELASLYLNRERILVLYITHPYFYDIEDLKLVTAKNDKTVNFEKISRYSFLRNENSSIKNQDIKIHPLWYIISIISLKNSLSGGSSEKRENSIDKFFIKRNSLPDKIYQTLNDISFYYSRHGY